MYLTEKQKIWLKNIVIKGDEWYSDYDKLFVDIIPFTYKVITNNNKYLSTLLLEHDDFLSIAFEAYIVTVEKIRNNNELFNYFLNVYHSILRDKIRATWKKHNKHGQRILNSYLEYEKINETTDIDIHQIFSSKLCDILLNDNFMLKFIDLKIHGKEIEEILRIMNMSKTTFYKKLNNSRTKIINSLF